MRKPSKDNDAAAVAVASWSSLYCSGVEDSLSQAALQPLWEVQKTMMIILVAAEYHTTVESMPTYLNEPEPS